MTARRWATALLLTAAAGCSRDWDGLSVQGASDAQSGTTGGGTAGVAGTSGGFGGFGATGGSGATGGFSGTGGTGATGGSGAAGGNDGGTCPASAVGATCQTVWGDGQGGPCGDCMIANCCNETNACFDSKACAGLVECISLACASTPDAACVEANCGACLSQEAVDAYNTIGTCQQASCGSAC